MRYMGGSSLVRKEKALQAHRRLGAILVGLLACSLAFSLTPLAAFAANDSQKDTNENAESVPADREVVADFVDTGDVTLYRKYTDDEYDDNLDPLERYEGYVAGSSDNLVAHDDGHTYWMPVKLALFTDVDGTLYYFLERGDRNNAMECICIDPSAALCNEEWKHTDETVELNIPAKVDVGGKVYSVISIAPEVSWRETYTYYNGTDPYSGEEVSNTTEACMPVAYFDAAVENRTNYGLANNDTSEFDDEGIYDFDKAISFTAPTGILLDADSGGIKLRIYVTGVHIPSTVETIGRSAFYTFNNLDSFTFGVDSQLRSIGAMAFYNMDSSCTIDLPDTLTTLGDKFYRSKSGSSSYSNVDGTVGRYVDASGNYCTQADRAIDTSCYNENVRPIGSLSNHGQTFFSSSARISAPGMLDFCAYCSFEQSGVVAFGASKRLVEDFVAYGFTWVISLNPLQLSNLENVEIEENDLGIYTCDGVVYQDEQEGSGSIETTILCFPYMKTSWKEMPATFTEIPNLGYTETKPNEHLREVVIPNTVTAFADWAFSYCNALESVTIADSVTKIGGYAFAFSAALSTLVIPDSVVEIDLSQFNTHGALKTLTLPIGLDEVYAEGLSQLETLNVRYNSEEEDSVCTFCCLWSNSALKNLNFVGNFNTLVFDDGSYEDVFGDSDNCFVDFSINLLGNIEQIAFGSHGDEISRWDGLTKSEKMSIYGRKASLKEYGLENTDTYSEKVSYDQLLSDEELGNCSVSIVGDSFTYVGSTITPPVRVVYDSVSLVEGADYTVSYFDNVNAGNASICVTGRGIYGLYEDTLEFTIDPAEIADVSYSDATYTGDEVGPSAVTWNGMELVEGTDFEIVGYANNTKPGKAKITVEGENNFTGEATGSFYIVVSDEDQAAVSAVEDAIAALSAEPTEEEVAVAQDAYDALSAAQKALVANAATLMDAQQYVLDQKIAAAQKAAEEAQKAAEEAGQKATEAEEAAKQAEEAEQTAKDAQAAAERKAKEAEEAEQAAKDAQAAAEQKAAEAEQAYQDLLKSSGTESTELSNAKRQISELQNELASTKTQTVTSVTVNDKNVTAKTVASAISKAGGDPKYVVSITLGKKVKKIGKKAFAKCSKTTNLTVTSTKLAKKTVKKSLKGSKISVVQVKGKAKTAKKYAKIFTKKNAGKAVAVVKA